MSHSFSSKKPFLDNSRSASDIANALCHLIVELSNGQLTIDDIDPDQHMLDRGYIDSLSGVILLARIDEIWAVDVDDACLVKGATTLNDLSVLIYGENQS